jgi:hypothetical protein
MSLQSRAQLAGQPIQFFIDPSSMPQMGESLEVSEEPVTDQANQDTVEVHEMLGDQPEMGGELEVSDPAPEIELEFVPGAKGAEKDPEPAIEVHEHDKEDKAEAVDEDPAKTQKNEKWDWSKRGPTGFIAWVKERCDDVPKHSGYDTAGLERAVAYLERLDNEVSKAMRMDLDGELDANQIEKVRSIIDNGVERLHDRLDKVKSSKKKNRKKKSEYQTEGLVKEGQKITGVQGVFVTVPLLISRIARVCINGMVSGGHDIEDLYARQVKFYKLDTREQAEVMQLLFDMGYAVRQDRGFMPDHEMDIASSDNMDWAANYKG